jgi:peptidyl-prolyl isomerase F (cyclophilin D)
MMIPGFDSGVMGMSVGETKALKCSPAEAYGEINPANVMKVPKKEVVDAVGEEYAVVGSKLMVGAGMPALITEVTD